MQKGSRKKAKHSEQYDEGDKDFDFIAKAGMSFKHFQNTTVSVRL